MRRKLLVWAGLLVACGGMLVASPATAATATRLVTGLAGGSGSTVGPGGALYVTERAAAVSRGSIRERVPSRRMRAACRRRPPRRDGRRLPRRHRLCPRNSGRSRCWGAMSSASTVWIGRTTSPSSRTSAHGRSTIRQPRRSTSRQGSSTRWTRFAAWVPRDRWPSQPRVGGDS